MTDEEVEEEKRRGERGEDVLSAADDGLETRTIE